MWRVLSWLFFWRALGRGPRSAGRYIARRHARRAIRWAIGRRRRRLF